MTKLEHDGTWEYREHNFTDKNSRRVFFVTDGVTVICSELIENEAISVIIRYNQVFKENNKLKELVKELEASRLR